MQAENLWLIWSLPRKPHGWLEISTTVSQYKGAPHSWTAPSQRIACSASSVNLKKNVMPQIQWEKKTTELSHIYKTKWYTVCVS